MRLSDDVPGDVTRLLIDWSNGKQEAFDELVPLVYEELRRLAERHRRKEQPGSTFATTALVHEAYLRLVDQRQVRWQDRAHFFAIAARMMRRILVDRARRRKYAKRGGGAVRLSLEQVPEMAAVEAAEVLDVDSALHALSAAHQAEAKVVELRFFGGLTSEEIAQVTDVSVATVNRRWRLARAWLFRHMKPEQGSEP